MVRQMGIFPVGSINNLDTEKRILFKDNTVSGQREKANSDWRLNAGPLRITPG